MGGSGGELNLGINCLLLAWLAWLAGFLVPIVVTNYHGYSTVLILFEGNDNLRGYGKCFYHHKTTENVKLASAVHHTRVELGSEQAEWLPPIFDIGRICKVPLSAAQSLP